MHWMEIEERQQLAEELAARGVRLDEGREWWQVGMVDDPPVESTGRRESKVKRRAASPSVRIRGRSPRHRPASRTRRSAR